MLRLQYTHINCFDILNTTQTEIADQYVDHNDDYEQDNLMVVDVDDSEFVINRHNNKKKKKIDFINERIVAALDAAKISDYKAMHLLAAVIESLGLKLDDFVLSRCTLNRFRKKNRITTANDIKANFKVNNFTFPF